MEAPALTARSISSSVCASVSNIQAEGDGKLHIAFNCASSRIAQINRIAASGGAGLVNHIFVDGKIFFSTGNGGGAGNLLLSTGRSPENNKGSVRQEMAVALVASYSPAI